MTFVPVIDISHHQQAVDFTKAKANGVAGVIIRATNGDVVDNLLDRHVADARKAGYPDNTIGFYAFCNPKSTTGRDGAKFFVDAVRRALGHLDTYLMFDAEQYTGEPGKRPVITGSAYAAWLAESIAATRELAPTARIVIYTGASFWNNIDAGQQFANIDTIIARYPIWPSEALGIADKKAQAQQLEAWMTTSPKPPQLATGWADWIMQRKARPPALTGLGQWSGWQFSAQFNCAGATYGAGSRDLDLNIIHDDAWARWTNTSGQVVVDKPPVDKPPVAKPPVAKPVVGPAAILQADQSLARDAALTSANARFSFIHQPDGNVVLYGDGTPRWSSKTQGANTDLLFMQGDGNLVLMDVGGQAVWNSKTNQNPGSHLELRDNGQAAIVAANGADLWVRG
jgi:hypothetical protein